MRYAIVTETYPPEINGVALTVQGLEQGLRERGNAVQVVRPSQAGDATATPFDNTLLVRGAGLPRYPGLRFGLPATRLLRRHWQGNRPDALYVATEGPLGWSALRAARQLGIPAATGFHTRFDAYMRDYGMPWLAPVALRWMRHFHNSAQATLVPTRELQTLLEAEGFDNVVRLARAVELVVGRTAVHVGQNREHLHELVLLELDRWIVVLHCLLLEIDDVHLVELGAKGRVILHRSEADESCDQILGGLPSTCVSEVQLKGCDILVALAEHFRNIFLQLQKPCLAGDDPFHQGSDLPFGGPEIPFRSGAFLDRQ